MSGRSEFDAAIIGGGPAGSTAARTLAERGRSVLLVERERFPRPHVGESLMPYDAALLTMLGYGPGLDEVGTIKRGAEFTGAGGDVRQVDFAAQGEGRVASTLNVERAAFDELLLRGAAEAGATVVTGARVIGLLTSDAGRITGLRFRTEQGTEDVRAGTVIDASGRAGLVSHQHLKLRQPSSRLRMVAVWRHFEQVDEATNPGNHGDIQIGDHPGGWVWAIPIREDKLSVGAVAPPEVFRALGPRRVFAEHVARIPRIRCRLVDARPEPDVRVERDFSYFTETVAGPGFFVVGDAGCFVDPIFSGGVFLAMVTGRRAGELADAVLSGGRETEAADEYSRFYKTGYDCYFRLTYAFYDHHYRLGRYLKSTGTFVQPHWLARLLSGDFWSRENILAQRLRAEPSFATFAPFEPLYGCPIYPELDSGGDRHPARSRSCHGRENEVRR